MHHQIVPPQAPMQPPVPPTAPAIPDAWSHTVLGDHNFWKAKGFLAWWYRHTAPADPAPGASFQQRDQVRRGRIASAIMLFLASILLLVAPIGLLGPNKQILYTALTVWAVIGLCIGLNRKGKVNLVGSLLCLSIAVGMYLSIVRAPGGLSPDDKDILYLLIIADLFIGAVLPVNWVFVPAVINIAFSVVELTIAPHTPALAAMLPTSASTILFRLIQLHVLVTGVMWIVGTHAREAIQRADRAEEVARLHHVLAQMAETQTQEAYHLNLTVQTIIGVLNRIAQGDLAARVALIEGETLWPLVGSLNTLLARYQRARQDERELETVRPYLIEAKRMEYTLRKIEEMQQPYLNAINWAIQGRNPLRVPLSLTPLDPFFQPLNGKYIVEPSPDERQPQPLSTHAHSSGR